MREMEEASERLGGTGSGSGVGSSAAVRAIATNTAALPDILALVRGLAASFRDGPNPEDTDALLRALERLDRRGSIAAGTVL